MSNILSLYKTVESTYVYKSLVLNRNHIKVNWLKKESKNSL